MTIDLQPLTNALTDLKTRLTIRLLPLRDKTEAARLMADLGGRHYGSNRPSYYRTTR